MNMMFQISHEATQLIPQKNYMIGFCNFPAACYLYIMFCISYKINTPPLEILSLHNIAYSTTHVALTHLQV